MITEKIIDKKVKEFLEGMKKKEKEDDETRTYYYVEVNRKMSYFRVKKNGSNDIIKSFKNRQEALDFIEELKDENKS